MIEEHNKMSPSVRDKAAILAGTPLAIVGVLLWESYFSVKLETISAVAVGGIFASVAGYLGHVIQTLIDRAITRSCK